MQNSIEGFAVGEMLNMMMNNGNKVLSRIKIRCSGICATSRFIADTSECKIRLGCTNFTLTCDWNLLTHQSKPFHHRNFSTNTDFHVVKWCTFICARPTLTVLCVHTQLIFYPFPQKNHRYYVSMVSKSAMILEKPDQVDASRKNYHCTLCRALRMLELCCAPLPQTKTEGSIILVPLIEHFKIFFPIFFYYISKCFPWR